MYGTNPKASMLQQCMTVIQSDWGNRTAKCTGNFSNIFSGFLQLLKCTAHVACGNAEDLSENSTTRSKQSVSKCDTACCCQQRVACCVLLVRLFPSVSQLASAAHTFATLGQQADVGKYCTSACASQESMDVRSRRLVVVPHLVCCCKRKKGTETGNKQQQDLPQSHVSVIKCEPALPEDGNKQATKDR